MNLGGNQLEKCVKCDGEYPIYNVLIVFCLQLPGEKEKKRKQKSKSCVVLLHLV